MSDDGKSIDEGWDEGNLNRVGFWVLVRGEV